MAFEIPKARYSGKIQELKLGGGDILVMRHPDAIRQIREMIGELTAK